MGIRGGMGRSAQVLVVAVALAVGGAGFAVAANSGGASDEVLVSTSAGQEPVAAPTPDATTAAPTPTEEAAPSEVAAPRESAAPSVSVSPLTEVETDLRDEKQAPVTKPEKTTETQPTSEADDSLPITDGAGRTRSPAPAAKPQYTDFAGCLYRKAPEVCRKEFPDAG